MIYDQLKVFRDTYDLLQQVFFFCSKLTRDHRYSLGEKLKSEILEVELAIFKANSSARKLLFVEKAQESMMSVKLLIRILYDMKQISLKQYTLASVRVEDINKQLSSWSKYASTREKSLD